MRTRGLIFILCLLAIKIQAQELIPMGTWRSHYNYEHTTLVEKTSNKIFAATTQGLIFYDIDDQSMNKLSKIDGLSDAGITALAFDKNEEYLLLGYQNGNLDLINSEGIQNLPVLLQSDVTESKSINHISFFNDNANLSTDFGLLVLTQTGEIEEAYQNLGENGEVIEVRASCILNDVLYLATETGVLAGALTNGDNLQDFNNWERFSKSTVYTENMISLSKASNKVYAATLSSLFKKEDENWIRVTFPLVGNEEIIRLKEGINGLLVLTSKRAMILDDSDTFDEISQPKGADINDIIQESKNLHWYADQSQGLSRLADGNADHIILNGPSENISKLKIVDGSVVALPELDKDYTKAVSNQLGYSFFDQGSWVNVAPKSILKLTNISDVTIINNKTFVTSFGQGVLDGERDQNITHENSPLEENEAETGNTLVSGMALDNAKSIWVTNFSNSPLQKWDGSQEWVPYDFGSFASTEPVSIDINSGDQIWMRLGHSEGMGVLAFDINSEVSRYVTSTGAGLPSNHVNDIAFGKEDEIWFATDQGIAYFPFSYGIIEDKSTKVILPIFNEGTLFEDKEVYALALDGGNRLWVGTQDGLWLFGENISEMVYHFTVENSPLPSNQVIDLVIHPATGELFVATDQGIVSYRTNATEGTNQHQKVKIYPNPVLPDFQGWVGFSGLANDVNIKITNVSGQLVRELNAIGGGASWDVLDYKGQRVNTGVYMVFSASQDGSETFVGKIAVIE